jgi:formate hydrogenlyase subunit 3/multisubunit Na+/H+ antiporter MnhD subunit
LFNALLLATTLVFMADNIWLFLIAWEIMALTAYCLVSFEHEKPETREAGVLYFIMSHIDAGCIILGFLLLFQASGDYSFDSLHALGPKMSPGKRDAAFVLFLLGFGIKAGIVPLHIWLPAAHPVAPSNVSALMSSVLIKTGIYGLTRVCFEFLGTPPLWWGVTVLAAGTLSAVLGVLYALMEHDLKRLLAYHSIENIGIILMGLGAALMFLHTGHPMLATLALIAGLYHTINHATFKGLLFLGAGAVLHATHTRNMEEMGGLIKRMPQTAFFFLIGAVAISALPPLNGFVSEWLTYQALLQGFGTTESLWRLVFPLSGAMLALTGALAAACFVKAFGISFLAQPRSEHAAHAHEAAPSMLFGMAMLTVACVLLGLFPTHFIRLMDPLTQQLTGQQLSAQLSLADGLVVVVVARDHARRVADALQLQRSGERNVLGEELILHLARDRQLALEALLLLGHHDELPEILRHRIERLAQLRKLVVPLHRNAIRKVGDVDVLGALVQLVHRARDRPAEPDARDQRDGLHDEEQRRDRDEQRERLLRPVALLEHQAEHGRKPRIDHQQQFVRLLLRRLPVRHFHRDGAADLKVERVPRRRDQRPLRRSHDLNEIHVAQARHKPGEHLVRHRRRHRDLFVVGLNVGPGVQPHSFRILFEDQVARSGRPFRRRMLQSRGFRIAEIAGAAGP